jgi:hypothetical protein
VAPKTVLILGRFTDERKAVLDGLREELRKRDYLPILFDFAVPATRDITETVSLLARMARFMIADLTDPSSIPKELEAKACDTPRAARSSPSRCDCSRQLSRRRIARRAQLSTEGFTFRSAAILAIAATITDG